MDQEHLKSNFNVVDCPEPLRFKIGDNVMCRIPSLNNINDFVFKEGVVVELWPPSAVPGAVYNVRLNCDESIISYQFDSNEFVRRIDREEGSDPFSFIPLNPQDMMFICAATGPFEVFKMFVIIGLLNVYKLNNLGRNIIQHAIATKNTAFVKNLRNNAEEMNILYYKLLSNIDFNGQSVLHQIFFLRDNLFVSKHLIKPMVAAKLTPVFLVHDKHGFTALDYMLLNFSSNADLVREITPHMVKAMVKDVQISLKNLKDKTDEAVVAIMEKKIKMRAETLTHFVKTSKEFVSLLSSLLRVFIIKEFRSCAIWFFFQLFCDHSEVALFVVELFDFCLRDKIFDEIWSSCTSAQDKSELASELTYELYHLFREWNPVEQSDSEFLASKRIADSQDGSTGRYLFDAQPITPRLQTLKAEDGRSLFQFWLHRLLYSKNADRSFLGFELCLLVPEKHGFLHPSILKLADLLGLNNLLWYIDHFKIGIHAEMDWFEIYELPWMCGASGFVQRGLSLCEFLCAFAVQKEDLDMFEHFLAQCPNRKFTVHGLNMLQMAVVAGKYLLVRVCIERRLFEVDDIFANDINALHRAILLGKQTSHMVLYLLPLVGNNCRSEPDCIATSHVALSSECKEVVAWARDIINQNTVREVYALIAEEPLGCASMRMLLNSLLDSWLSQYQFTTVEIFQTIVRIVRFSLLNGSLSGCLWFCDLIAIDRFRGLLPMDQRSEIMIHLLDFAFEHESSAHPLLLTYLRDFLRQLRDEDAPSPATLIQSCFRRHRVQKRHKWYLGENYVNWLQFRSVWGELMSALAYKGAAVRPVALTWRALKEQYSMVTEDAEKELSLIESITAQVTSRSATPLMPQVASTSLDFPPLLEETAEEIDTECDSAAVAQNIDELAPSLENIELSQSVVKWFVSAELILKQFFLKRMMQLADGQRSYALSNRLLNTDCPIYETKLDVGMRILWTKLQRGTSGSILVWFVTKHSGITRCKELIEHSFKRQARQFKTTEGSQEEVLKLEEDDVLVDPVGNCPLKAYSTNRTEIDQNGEAMVRDWKPKLKLSTKQKQVNDETGTVLLLGRSGTGKTLCLCDRMLADRQNSPSILRQLFVSRNKRLCDFVCLYMSQHVDAVSVVNCHFVTLASFTSQMSINVKMARGRSTFNFAVVDKVDFKRFCALLPPIRAKCLLSPCVIWLQIRSFIKGSVEAALQFGPVSLAQYTDLKVFGLDHCRLSVEDRKKVYAVFRRYQDLSMAQGLWDDADFTLDLLTRSKLEPLSTQYDKVYVDEVQDNTQAEIVLYFLAAGMNTQSLFLAGDPAQSVVEGVDFRFEDIRSIVYKLSNGTESIQKPVKLSVNFRSHSGILKSAGAVLDMMYTVFPGSSGVLPRDEGLFKGPRPTFCHVDGMEGLAKVLSKNERLVILCRDEEVERVESELTRMNVKNIVLGIRAAKGLEFSDVVIVNFFSQVDTDDQSAWKALFAGKKLLSADEFPHLELQLKLLYTAITRCCNRLLFVETEKTQLTSAFFRWLASGDLAEQHDVSSEAAVLMTSDEWRVQGIEFVLSAEGEQTASLLQKAIKCFALAGDAELSTRVSMQVELERLMSVLSEGGGVMAVQEQEAAGAVLRGVKCGLVSEVREVVRLLQHRVQHKELFGYEVARFLM